MPVTYESQNHRMAHVTLWEPEREAVFVAPEILMSHCNSNAYLVASDEGDVLINVGWSGEAERTRERFEEALGRRLDVKKIIFTQSHADHVGGHAEFDGPEVDTIAQRNMPQVHSERDTLRGFWGPRAARLHASRHAPNDPRRNAMMAESRRPIKITTTFGDSYRFEVGGRPFELYSTPHGETLDSLIVWLPRDRAVFTGNLTGALWGALPNLYTLRGDRIRSAAGWLRDVDLVLGLQPEYLITGHGDPFVGEDVVQEELGKLRGAVADMYDYTIGGMNAGKDLWTLMRDYEPPTNAPEAEARGKAMWFVRAIWEENVGWFRFESTTELYPVSRSAIAGDLVELAGGPDVLSQRAAEHVAAGRPLEAIHLTDIVLHEDPADSAAREAQIAALELLLERSGGVSYDEVCWLETELALARAAIA